MTEQQIMSYIELTSENTALKVQQKITEAIATHEKGCANQFNGRIEMMENAVVSLAKRTENRFDQFGPFLAALLKNWKAVAVIAVVFMTMLGNFKSGTPMTVDQIKEVIKQVQSSDVTEKTVGTAPGEKKEYQIN